ncbi:MAG: 4-fold beta flower protein [Allosphingosinicella sp.]
MADFLYTSEGRPQGFRLGNHVYAIDGTPVGRVFAEKVYAMDGAYVGALVNNMVVDRPDVSRRAMPPAEAPAPAVPPARAEPRRPVSQSWPDCFALLLAREDEVAAPEPAGE